MIIHYKKRNKGRPGETDIATTTANHVPRKDDYICFDKDDGESYLITEVVWFASDEVWVYVR